MRDNNPNSIAGSVITAAATIIVAIISGLFLINVEKMKIDAITNQPQSTQVILATQTGKTNQSPQPTAQITSNQNSATDVIAVRPKYLWMGFFGFILLIAIPVIYNVIRSRYYYLFSEVVPIIFYTEAPFVMAWLWYFFGVLPITTTVVIFVSLLGFFPTLITLINRPSHLSTSIVLLSWISAVFVTAVGFTNWELSIAARNALIIVLATGIPIVLFELVSWLLYKFGVG